MTEAQQEGFERTDRAPAVFCCEQWHLHPPGLWYPAIVRCPRCRRLHIIGEG